MSRILTVLKNKNKYEKIERDRKQNEMTRLRTETAYTARLSDSMKLIDMMLSDSEVDKVTIEIPESQLTLFTRAIYREEMTQYSIIQVGDYMFEIGSKMVNF